MVSNYSEPNEKVYFMLDKDEWHGFSSESLWATLSDSSSGAQIMNAPFFVKGISNKDVVEVKKTDGEVWFSKVRKKSGHATLRLLARKFLDNEKSTIRALDLLERSGCAVEGASLGEGRIFAVDVPTYVAAEEVVRIVESGAELDLWDAEMGDVAGRKGFWHY
jgi:hypothetical protein